jgi:hypothetical protein
MLLMEAARPALLIYVGRGHAAAHGGEPKPGGCCPARGAARAPRVAVRRLTPLPRQRLPGPGHQGSSDSVPYRQCPLVDPSSSGPLWDT